MNQRAKLTPVSADTTLQNSGWLTVNRVDKPCPSTYYSPIMATERLRRRIEHLLDEAEEAISQHKWEIVRGHAQSVLALDPDNPDGIALIEAAHRASAASDSSVETAPTASPSASNAAMSNEQPTSFAGGRYQVKRFLGEGGKKKVYLAHDTLLDREVAFALIKTDGLDETSRSRIQREAQAMGRLGSHPHIVTVFDLGEEQDQPFMVTELMGGGDVEGMIEDATDHRLSLEQAINVANETCRGLDFAHGRGVVHRDLKPGNIWLAADGTAKIGDFGLAVSLDRSRLTAEGMMVGTVSYMPPEQAMGGEVTPRSDLYSLGAMLYEMVTGRPPFLGDDSVAIIGQHINTPPVAPTWHNTGCPRPLEALILRLLAKDPAERPESASDVLAALDAINVEHQDAGARSSHGGMPPQDDAHALDSLAGGVFVGRQREMGELKGCLEDALSGRGRLVTLVGEPGIGKTRTAQELATYAGLRQAQVLWGRCYEGEGVPPYWPWVQAIRSYVQDQESSELQSDMGAGAADIAEIVSDVREKLPDLKPPPALEPEQARFRLFDSITTFLKTASRRRPLVLVLDDLHWADHPSLHLLEFVARELANARVLVIGTYRDVEVSRRHPLSQTLGELTRERLFQRVLLRGLDEEDVGRFVELVSGVAPPQGMIAAVHRQTEGNPLFMTEVVRLLVQEGTVGAGQTGSLPDTDSWQVRIPEGVREVIGRRLDRLSQRCNETLTVASVIGREFTLGQLQPVINDPAAGPDRAMTEDQLLEVVDEALGARVIEELPSSVGHFQFTHALIQGTLADELSATRRVRLHARIAQALEGVYGPEADSHAAELAHHFHEAQTVLGTERLVHYALLGGERALTAYAYEDAQLHFQRGLAAKENAPLGAETGRLLYGLGRVQVATLSPYELRSAVETLERAFQCLLDAGEVVAAVAVAEVPLPPTAGYITGMGQLIYKALDLVDADSLQAARLQASYARAAGLEEGDYQAAEVALDRALKITQREGDQGLELRIRSFACDVEGYHGQWAKCLETCLSGMLLTETVDDPRSELLVNFWAAGCPIILGHPEVAPPRIAAALSAARRLRHNFYMSRTLYMELLLAHLTGDWDKGRHATDQGLAVSPREFRLLLGRCLLELELGNFEEAREFLERLQEEIRHVASGPTYAHAMVAALAPVFNRVSGTDPGSDTANQAEHIVLTSLSRTPVLDVMTRVGPSLKAVQQGYVAEAKEQYEAVAAAPGKEFVILAGVNCHRLLGLLAQAMGEPDKAVEHFEDSLAYCRIAGFRPELAWTCYDYAELLLQTTQSVRPELVEGPGGSTSSPRAPSEDRSKAMSLLDESLALSSELGMRPLMERVLSKRQILGA